MGWLRAPAARLARARARASAAASSPSAAPAESSAGSPSAGRSGASSPSATASAVLPPPSEAPAGAEAGDPLPFDPARADTGADVVDIIMSKQPTPLLQACRARGLHAQAGFEMLVQQVPEYLRFFGFDAIAATMQSDLSEIRARLYPK